MNGAVEAANKNIKKIVQKMVVTYKDRHEMLPFALHGYRTTVRTSTGATPFLSCLWHGSRSPSRGGDPINACAHGSQVD